MKATNQKTISCWENGILQFWIREIRYTFSAYGALQMEITFKCWWSPFTSMEESYSPPLVRSQRESTHPQASLGGCRLGRSVATSQSTRLYSIAWERHPRCRGSYRADADGGWLNFFQQCSLDLRQVFQNHDCALNYCFFFSSFNTFPFFHL